MLKGKPDSQREAILEAARKGYGMYQERRKSAQQKQNGQRQGPSQNGGRPGTTVA